MNMLLRLPVTFRKSPMLAYNIMNAMPLASQPLLSRRILVPSRVANAAGRLSRSRRRPRPSRQLSRSARPRRYTFLHIASLTVSMLCIDVHRGPIVQLRPLFAELYSPVFNVGAEIERMLVDDTGLACRTPSTTSPRTRRSAALATASTSGRQARWTTTSARCASSPPSSASRSATVPRSSPRSSRRPSSTSRPSTSIRAHATYRRCPPVPPVIDVCAVLLCGAAVRCDWLGSVSASRAGCDLGVGMVGRARHTSTTTRRRS